MRSTQKEFKITVDGQGKEVVSVFVSLIKKGMRVVDVGAYHGFFSFLASKLVGEEGEVIAFEPLPEAFRFLRMECKNLKLKNVRIYNYAVSDKIGTRKLRVNGSGSHFLREDDIFQPFVIVKTVSLDSFLSNKKIDVAIINVERNTFTI